MKLWKILVFIFAVKVCLASSTNDDVTVEVEGESEEQGQVAEEVQEAPKQEEEPFDPEKIYTAEKDSRVTYQILKQGRVRGPKLGEQDAALLHFNVTDTKSGEVLFSTYDLKLEKETEEKRGQVRALALSLNVSIAGLEYGILGMANNETRRVFVPADLVVKGQGLYSEKNIPRGRDLTFDVYLMRLQPNYQHGMPDMFVVYDRNVDGYIDKEEISLYILEEGTFGEGHLVTKMALEFLRKDDRDGDKRVSWDEFSGPKFEKRFKTHDEL